MIQYELWADLALQNRHLRRNNWCHWIVHLLLVLGLLLVATRPLTAIRVDSMGEATLVGPLTPANRPSPEEAEHVARLISQYLLEVTSGSIARDLSKAFALMTPDFERAYREKAQNDQLLPLLEKGSVRTQLVFDSQPADIKVQKEADGRPSRYFVTLLAQLNVHRAELNTAPVLAKTVTIRVTLTAVPRGPRTLNGLLVDYFEKQVLDPAPPITGAVP